MLKYTSKKYIGKYGRCHHCNCAKVMFFVCNRVDRMVHVSQCMSCKRILKAYKGIYSRDKKGYGLSCKPLPRDYELLLKKFPQLRGKLKNHFLQPKNHSFGRYTTK